MADLMDVLGVLRDTIATALYPAAPTAGAASPVAGVKVLVEAGWPAEQALNDDLKAGKVHVSIYPRPAERNTTRYSDDWEELDRTAPTYTLAADGQDITVSGAPPSPYRAQNLAIFLNGAPYTLTATAGQTAAQVAAALHALIAEDRDASISGAIITVPDDVRIGALRVGTTGTITRELRRVEREFQVTVWAPSPAARDAVSKPVDVALAKTPFLTMPDGYAARLLYKGSPITDMSQRSGLYRRDLIYSVEYATTEAADATAIVTTETAAENDDGALFTVHA